MRKALLIAAAALMLLSVCFAMPRLPAAAPASRNRMRERHLPPGQISSMHGGLG